MSENDIIQIQTDERRLATAADVSGAQQALEEARALPVTTLEEANAASERLKLYGKAQKALEERRKGITKPMDEAKKGVMDMFRAPLEALEGARNEVKRKIAMWHSQEEQRAAEERRKAEEKARKEAERAQAKVEKYAEEGREDKVEEWSQKGEQAEAAVPPQNEKAKVAGVALRTVYEVEVHDVIEACRGVADGKIPPAAIKFNQGELNKFARAWKGNCDMPGCKVTSRKVAAG